MATYKLPSQKKHVGSGTAKLATQYKGVGSASIKQQTQAEAKARELITSSGERAKEIDRTQQALAALKTGTTTTAGTRVLTPTTAFSGTSGMLGAVSSNAKLTASQQAALTNLLVSQSSTKTASATPAEKDKLRVILGKGYVAPKPVTDRFLQNQLQATAMRKALAEDLALRIKRINTRETELNKQQSQLSSAERKLLSYNKYIKNGQFTGNQAQYKAYVSSYNAYEKAYNNYSSTLELQNIDVTTYNKNLDSYDKKASKYTKTKQKLEAKIQKVLSTKIGTPEQIANKLTKTLNNAYNVQSDAITAKVPKNSQAYKDWEKTMGKTLTQADINNYAKFYGGMYKSVYDQPLKAVANAALFFVGAPVISGLGKGVKAIALAGKASRSRTIVVTALGKAIEGGLVGLYVGSSGARYALAGDVAEYGYITGDILFNEILAAGIGAKYGIKVVSKLPKGVRKIRGAGTKVKQATASRIKQVETITKVNWEARKKRIATMKQLETDRKALVETANAYRKAGKSVPKWISDELRTIGNRGKSGYLKSQSSFQKFLADTRAEVSPATAKKRRAAQQQAVAKTKTVEKTEDELIAAFERQQREFMSVEQELRDTGFIQKQTQRQVSLKVKQRVKLDDIVTSRQKLKQLNSIEAQIKAKSKQVHKTVAEVKKLRTQYSYAQLATLTQKQYNEHMQKLDKVTKLAQKQMAELRQTQTQYRQQLSSYKTVQKSIVRQMTSTVTKTASATKTRRPKAPTTKAKEKPPEIKIPKLPTVSKSRRTPKKKRTQTRRVSTTTAINKVATFKSLFG